MTVECPDHLTGNLVAPVVTLPAFMSPTKNSLHNGYETSLLQFSRFVQIAKPNCVILVKFNDYSDSAKYNDCINRYKGLGSSASTSLTP